jgi:hypothetical protein
LDKANDLELRDVATEGHSQNGAIEVANRILRMFFDRIVAANLGAKETATVVEVGAWQLVSVYRFEVATDAAGPVIYFSVSRNIER